MVIDRSGWDRDEKDGMKWDEWREEGWGRGRIR